MLFRQPRWRTGCGAASRTGLRCASSSACVPCSATRPASSTTMRSTRSMVDRRCAMTIVVRPRISASIAACTWRSDSESSADVASSRIRIGAFLRIARAMARRWRCPPDSRTPFSPTSVSNPCGSGADEVQRVRGVRRALDGLARRVRHRAVGDVGGDGVVEQRDVLAHQREVAAQIGERERVDVVAVEQDAARRSARRSAESG